MHLKVFGDEEMYFEDDVYSVSVKAVDGKVDFLDNHTDYLTVLHPEKFIKFHHAKGSETHNLDIKDDGIVFIEDNTVYIL